MPKQTCLLLLLIPATLLFSCAGKKKTVPSPSQTIASEKMDTSLLSAADMINLGEYSQSFNRLSIQRFTAAPGKVSVITAQKGLKVTVDPGVLEKENGGKVNNDIHVEIIELTDTEDLFKSNTATVSNGRLLASGGSYFIGMSCEGDKLRIKRGHTLNVEFPVLKAAEMELFYGERDSLENMNWKRAGVRLLQPEQEEFIQFTDSNRYSSMDYRPAFAYKENGEAIVYPSLKQKVYLYDKLITLEALLDTVNRNGTRLVVDTVHMWPALTAQLLPGQKRDTGFLLANYGPEKQFILKPYRDAAKEKERKALAEQQQKKAMENWQPQTLAGQIQKYYDPAGIRNLGWLNCDRFYNNPQESTIELDLPISFNPGSLQYFLLYPAFNGLMNGVLRPDDTGAFVLSKLPEGEKLVLIAFAKKDGKVYHSRSAFVISDKKAVQVNFTEISIAAMNTMFGRNARI